MTDLGGFDASQYEPADAYDLLPAGWYTVMITASEMKPTKKRDGSYLWLELEIVEGKHQGRKLFDRLNLDNPNPDAVRIANGTLSAICRAVDVMTPRSSEELHHKRLMAKVRVKKSDEFGDSNEVKGYKALEKSSGKPAPPPRSTLAPTETRQVAEEIDAARATPEQEDDIPF